MYSRELYLTLLKEHNVLVVPGTAFGDSGEGYIRISYAASFERLEAFISSLRELNNKVD